MKLCDLTQSYAGTGGGVRTYLEAKHDHVRSRTDAGYLRIVPGAEDAVLRQGRSTLHRIASPRIPGSPAYRLLFRSDKVLRILRRERPDVIEVHCAYNLPWTALVHRSHRPCAVVGFCMTDIASAYVEPAVRRVAGSGAARAARRLAQRYIRSLYGRCDATVAPSPDIAARLRSLGLRNVVIIPLGVDRNVFHPSRRDPAIRKRFGVEDDAMLLVYAGRLDREKRPDLLVSAFERLPPSFRGTLVLIGDGPLRDELRDRGRRHGRIHVLPFEADRAALATLLASADLYVSAMPHETFGLSVIEAQACGLPVLGVRSGAMVDRVPPGTGVLAAPDSPADMARVLGSVSREQWKRMGHNARDHVERHFSWQHTFDSLLELYTELCRAGT